MPTMTTDQSSLPSCFKFIGKHMGDRQKLGSLNQAIAFGLKLSKQGISGEKEREKAGQEWAVRAGHATQGSYWQYRLGRIVSSVKLNPETENPVW